MALLKSSEIILQKHITGWEPYLIQHYNLNNTTR